jgi:predicted CxxxxCH...CXXCH cytochrome family protein
VASTSGAPPQDIDDGSDPVGLSFAPHPVHESGRISTVFDCGSCHRKPESALDPGHLFDDPTPGVAEVVFPAGVYDPGTRTCSELACHGDGQGANGRVGAADGPRTCGSCHPDAADPARWDLMSDRHPRHLREAFACAECHPDAEGNDAIDQPALHVDGAAEVELPVGIVFDPTARTCDGTCHGEGHRGRVW